MTCHDAATLMSTGALATASRTTRLRFRLHLLICRYCRRFLRQMGTITTAARRVSGHHHDEPRASFERDLVDRLRL